MTKTRIKQISFLLALVMLFGAMSLTIVATDDTEYYATLNTTSSVTIFATAAWGDGKIVPPSKLPSVLTVKKANDSYYYVTSEDWPEAYAKYRYIQESSLTIIAPLQNTTTAQLGSFTVSVDGAIPSDAKLHIQSIAE